ncbi:MAG: DUF3108 domain-containing protein [Marinilabiliaceae bacterium]|nr:DUF3108 domain-containing protein [Marinilabiliaceae bacterium]
MKLIKIITIFCVLSFFAGEMNAQKNPFGAGEELKYSLSWGIVKAGEGVLSVKDSVLRGRKVFHLTALGYTTGVASIWKVHDVYESFVDTRTVQPVKSIRNIREGKYRYYNEVLFRHGKDSTYVNCQKKGERYVTPDIYDIVSAFYIGRKKYFNDSMVEGQIIVIQTYFGHDVFPLRIKYRGIETIKTKFGRVECYKFSPVTEVGRAFKGEDDMQVWISRDDNKLPIKIRFNLVVGSFICELDSYKGLQNSFSSLKK